MPMAHTASVRLRRPHARRRSRRSATSSRARRCGASSSHGSARSSAAGRTSWRSGSTRTTRAAPPRSGSSGLIRLIPAAVAAPFTASLADRYSRVGVMIASDLTRCALMIGAALTIASDGPAPVVYALVALSTVSGTVFRPAQSALLPALVAVACGADRCERGLEHARERRDVPRPRARRAAARRLEPGGRVRRERRVVPLVGVPRARPPTVRAGAGGTAKADGARRASGMLAGIATIAREPTLRTLVGLYTAQTLVAGAVNVLVVVTSFELLELDEAGVGLLYAAVGVGGLIGGFVALLLSSSRAARAGLRDRACPVRAADRADRRAPGRGRGCGRAGGARHRKLDRRRQRAHDHAARGPGRGARARARCARRSAARRRSVSARWLAPGLIAAVGAEAALVIVGVLLPTLALLTRPSLRPLDTSTSAPEATGLLRGVPMLAALARADPRAPRARGCADRASRPGETIVREGDAGDRFYVVAVRRGRDRRPAVRARRRHSARSRCCATCRARRRRPRRPTSGSSRSSASRSSPR